MMNGNQGSPSRMTGGGQVPNATKNQGATGMGKSGAQLGTFHASGPSVFYVFGQPGTYNVNTNFGGNMGRTFSSMANPASHANVPSGSGNEASRNYTARMTVPNEVILSHSNRSTSTSATLPSTSEEETSRFFQ